MKTIHKRQLITRLPKGDWYRKVWWPHYGAFSRIDDNGVECWPYLFIPFPIPIRIKCRFL